MNGVPSPGQNRILQSRNNPQKAREPQRDHQPQPLAGARLPKKLLCVAPKDSASRHSSPIWTHQTHTRQHSESKEPTFTFLWSLIAGLWCFHQPVSNLVWWFNPNVDSTFEWGTQEDRTWEGGKGEKAGTMRYPKYNYTISALELKQNKTKNRGPFPQKWTYTL